METYDEDVSPWQPILDFEQELATYTGAPYAVTTDRCTHAIEIALRLRTKTYDSSKCVVLTEPIKFTAFTYVSVVMVMHKLNIAYKLTDEQWRGKYQFHNTNIWDCARLLERGMYEAGQTQCLSFGRTKPLTLGFGGAILTDDKELYERASRMRYDGRDLFSHKKWSDQTEWEPGFHYYMTPEQCQTAGFFLDNEIFTVQEEHHYNYPDCRELNIKH